MTPRCPKCHSNAVSTISFKQFETFEEEYLYRCLDCKREWYVYADMTDADEIRDMKLYIEMQREERGDY